MYFLGIAAESVSEEVGVFFLEEKLFQVTYSYKAFDEFTEMCT